MGRHEERNVKCDRESEGVPMARLAMEHRCKQRGGREAVGNDFRVAGIHSDP